MFSCFELLKSSKFISRYICKFRFRRYRGHCHLRDIQAQLGLYHIIAVEPEYINLERREPLMTTLYQDTV